jgi:threonylcarbamoyladenosine tRNA methylthiotransferase MtaB
VSLAGPKPQALEVVTFGCRLNTLDSQAIRDAAGVQNDVVVLNTCAVTGEAVRQARQAIRRMARERPQARIVVTGCAAETEGERFAAMPEVFRVIGNGLKAEPATWTNLAVPGLRLQPSVPVLGPLAARGAIAEGRTRAFVQVQTGCDHDCTFCIIPKGRGVSRRRRPWPAPRPNIAHHTRYLDPVHHLPADYPHNSDDELERQEDP